MHGIGRISLNKVNNHQEECLNILQEECAEVIQAASKIKRFGIQSYHPSLSTSNLENLEMEIGDVLCLIDIILESDIGLSADRIEIAKNLKRERLAQWSNIT